MARLLFISNAQSVLQPLINKDKKYNYDGFVIRVFVYDTSDLCHRCANVKALSIIPY